MRNGSNGVEELRAAFADRPDLVFRHFADCDVPYMTWQAGRHVCDVITLANGYGLLVERFELIAWSSTREQLIDKLA